MKISRIFQKFFGKKRRKRGKAGDARKPRPQPMCTNWPQMYLCNLTFSNLLQTTHLKLNQVPEFSFPFHKFILIILTHAPMISCYKSITCQYLIPLSKRCMSLSGFVTSCQIYVASTVLAYTPRFNLKFFWKGLLFHALLIVRITPSNFQEVSQACRIS